METGKRCLIVVDYQKDFVDGSLGFEKAVTLDHGIAEKIRLYRSRGDDVMFTLDTHNDDYPTTQEGKISPCRTASPERLDTACSGKQRRAAKSRTWCSSSRLSARWRCSATCARTRIRKSSWSAW